MTGQNLDPNMQKNSEKDMSPYSWLTHSSQWVWAPPPPFPRSSHLSKWTPILFDFTGIEALAPGIGFSPHPTFDIIDFGSTSFQESGTRHHMKPTQKRHENYSGNGTVTNWRYICILWSPRYTIQWPLKMVWAKGKDKTNHFRWQGVFLVVIVFEHFGSIERIRWKKTLYTHDSKTPLKLVAVRFLFFRDFLKNSRSPVSITHS